MRLYCVLVLLTIQSVNGETPSRVRRQASSASAIASTSPSGQYFHHRVWQSCMFHVSRNNLHVLWLTTDISVALVVGDYLYIDGGEVATWDGTGDGFQTESPQEDGNIVSPTNKLTAV